MSADKFLKILTQYTPEKMMEYLLQNGKGPKPISPFCFISDEEKEKMGYGRDAIHESVDGGDTSNNS